MTKSNVRKRPDYSDQELLKRYMELMDYVMLKSLTPTNIESQWNQIEAIRKELGLITSVAWDLRELTKRVHELEECRCKKCKKRTRCGDNFPLF